MPQKLEIYKCNRCGNIIEIYQAGQCVPTCCGEPMKLMKEGATDGALEKHVPVITKIDGGYKVSVGSVAHPMEEKHYIQWISLQTEQGNQRKALKPGQEPTVTFAMAPGDKFVAAYEYCNLHGLWKKA